MFSFNTFSGLKVPSSKSEDNCVLRCDSMCKFFFSTHLKKIQMEKFKVWLRENKKFPYTPIIHVMSRSGLIAWKICFMLNRFLTLQLNVCI